MELNDNVDYALNLMIILLRTVRTLDVEYIEIIVNLDSIFETRQMNLSRKAPTIYATELDFSSILCRSKASKNIVKFRTEMQIINNTQYFYII
ncbi:hypothetical protein HZS_2675 [Henneguya salminicola]|nr:hypothetical protein HZS_2675 [Henneguya salminicola]